MLIGYYPLMTRLQDDLPEVLAAIRADRLSHGDGRGGRRRHDGPARADSAACRFLCAERDGGRASDGRSEPRAMIEAFRDAGATGLLGIKLGERGALLSPRPGEFVDVAGGSRRRGRWSTRLGRATASMAGCWRGSCAGSSPADAGRLGGAAGACCVTGLGATIGRCAVIERNGAVGRVPLTPLSGSRAIYRSRRLRAGIAGWAARNTLQGACCRT